MIAGAPARGRAATRTAAALLLLALAAPLAAAPPSFAGAGGPLRIEDFLLLESPRAERSHLDLSDATPGVIRYSGGLLPSATAYSPKMYTFKASFALDPSLAREDLSLYVGLSEYPLRIYLNGTEILKRGRYEGGRYNSSMRTVASLFLSPDLLRYGEAGNSLVVEAYPEGERWGLDRFLVDRSDRVARMVFERNLVGVDLVRGAFVLASLIGLYFLALFVFGQFKRPTYLLFAMVCASFCLSYFNMATFYEANDEVLAEAASKAGLVLLSSFTLAFCCEFTSVLNRKRLFPFALLGVGLAIAAYILTRQSKESILEAFGYAMNMIIVPQLWFDVGILAYALAKKRDRQAIVLLAAFAFVIASAAHDVVALNRMSLPYAWLAAYGFIPFVIAVFALLVRTYSQYERRANSDWLTGLANRSSFDFYLAEEIDHTRRGGDRLSVLMLDVDHFKLYNDTYGHIAGDACLRKIGRAMEAALARPSDLAARYGGEEFAGILPGTDYAGALALAERLRSMIEALAIPHATSKVASVVTVSIGVVSLASAEGATPEALLEAADRLLYEAKSAGRNRTAGKRLECEAPAGLRASKGAD